VVVGGWTAGVVVVEDVVRTVVVPAVECLRELEKTPASASDTRSRTSRRAPMTRAFRVELEAKGDRRARDGAELPSQSSAGGNTRSSVRASSGGTV
jgi:hypothetical protein